MKQSYKCAEDSQQRMSVMHEHVLMRESLLNR